MTNELGANSTYELIEATKLLKLINRWFVGWSGSAEGNELFGHCGMVKKDVLFWPLF